MKIAIRKEPSGSIYIDKEIFLRTKEITDEQGYTSIVPTFTEEELAKPPYNYKTIEINDRYKDCVSSDFNDDLTFNAYKYNERKQEDKKEELRLKRKPLLIAFDKYKSNVTYGVEFESEEQREKIINWYKNLLELDASSFENIPDRIKYYL